MNYASIKEYDIANGTGVRLSLFVSGCTNHCKGCFSKETWDFDFGEPFTRDVELQLLITLGEPNIKGLSILGGDPCHLRNWIPVYDFMEEAKRRYPDKDIWVWTGYLFEELNERFDLSLIDVLVDGRFEEELQDWKLRFRGSSNQRIINVPESLKQGTVILKEDY